MIKICIILTLALLFFEAVYCADDKGKGIQSIRPIPNQVKRTSGTREYHQFKAKRNTDFHSRAKVAYARQKGHSLKNPKARITQLNDLSPVVDHFDIKRKKNLFALWQLDQNLALPGPKTLKGMRLKEEQQEAAAAASSSGQQT